MTLKRIRFLLLILLFVPTVLSAQHIITPHRLQTEPTKPSEQVQPERNQERVMPAADMCLKGNGYHQKGDYEQALLWYRKAALQKNAMAQNAIGEYYEKGLGVEQDLLEAERWYRSAAEQGYEPATRNLERMKNK